ncbi:MAG TPA: hypothetical protein VLX68_09570 [Chitinivibrionales bacterium]|nr:hypothetical protein [Chitinivibrionales bacterium]
MNAAKFIRCLFILNIFIWLARLESGLCVTSDNSEIKAKSSIELVIHDHPSINITFCNTFFSPIRQPDCSRENPCINQFVQTEYNAFALQVLKLHSVNNGFFHPLISITQKHSIWHQSADDIHSSRI